MIIGIVSTIFSTLGIYGFFTGNLFLLYLGMFFVIIEHLIGIYTGQEKPRNYMAYFILCYWYDFCWSQLATSYCRMFML